MAANWNNPTLTSLYVDFLAELKARDVDVLTMAPGTNLPVGAKRWNAPTNTFQNWDGAAWVNLVLGAAGGGTGSTSVTPLGTMAFQNSNAVAITGGTISGVNLDAGAIVSGILALNRGGTGASLALGSNGSFLQSNGAQVIFGTSGAALTNLNAGAITTGNLPAAQMPTGGTWNLPTLLEINNASYVRFLNGGIIVGPIGYMGAGTINAQAYFLNGIPLSTGGSGIPSGLMAFFSGGCPAGWTFVAASEGRAIRSMSTGAGLIFGSDSHIHGFSVPAGGGGDINSGGPDTANSGGQSGMGFTGKNFDAGSSFGGTLLNAGGGENHTHNINHAHNFNVPGFPGHSANTASAESWPPIINYAFCRKD